MGKLKEKLNDFFEKRADRMDAEGERLLHKLMRSSYFHDYYEGYTEYREKANNLRGYKIRRLYTGKYYQQKLSDRMHVLIRSVYIVLLFICILSLCIGASLPAQCNYLWFVTLPQAVSILLVFRDVWALIMYIAGGRKLKIRDYKSGPVSVKKVSMITFISLSILSLSAFFCVIIISGTSNVDLYSAILFVFSAVAMLGIWLIERTVEYCVIPNENVGNEQDEFQVDSL